MLQAFCWIYFSKLVKTWLKLTNTTHGEKLHDETQGNKKNTMKLNIKFFR